MCITHCTILYDTQETFEPRFSNDVPYRTEQCGSHCSALSVLYQCETHHSKVAVVHFSERRVSSCCAECTHLTRPTIDKNHSVTSIHTVYSPNRVALCMKTAHKCISYRLSTLQYHRFGAINFGNFRMREPCSSTA